jgi:hypothetical protein
MYDMEVLETKQIMVRVLPPQTASTPLYSRSSANLLHGNAPNLQWLFRINNIIGWLQTADDTGCDKLA